MHVSVMNPDYIIYLDNVRVDHIVTDYRASYSINSQIPSASINMIFNFGEDYSPDFNKYYTKAKRISQRLKQGIPSNTNLFIFVKNIITGFYECVFNGNISGANRNVDSYNQIVHVSFSALGGMNMLNKIETIIAIPTNVFEHSNSAPEFKLKAQGMKIDNTIAVQTEAEVNLSDMNVSDIYHKIKDHAQKFNMVYSDNAGSMNFNDILSRVDIVSDIDSTLMKSDLVDLRFDTSTLSIETIYVTLSKFLNPLMFEFFETPKGRVRIKGPFWNEPVPMNHVIAGSFIVNESENSDFESEVTRIFAMGGVSSDMQQMSGGTDDLLSQMLVTPMAAYTEDGKIGMWATLNGLSGASLGNDSVTAGSEIVPKASETISQGQIISGSAGSKNPTYGQIKTMIDHACYTNGLPAQLVYAIAWTESAWAHYDSSGAVKEGKNLSSSKIHTSSDWGIMQINDKAHPDAFPVCYGLPSNLQRGIDYIYAKYNVAKKHYTSPSDIARATYSLYNTGSNFSRWQSSNDNRDKNFYNNYKNSPWSSKSGSPNQANQSASELAASPSIAERTFNGTAGIWKKNYTAVETGIGWIDAGKNVRMPTNTEDFKTARWVISGQSIKHIGKSGVVRFVGRDKSDDLPRMGSTIRVELSEGPYKGCQIVYGGLSEIFVSVGESVSEGSEIGLIENLSSPDTFNFALEIRSKIYSKYRATPKGNQITISPMAYTRDFVDKISTPTTGMRIAIGIDAFLKSTERERTVGLKPAAIYQPIIKSSLSAVSDATDVLKRYATFEFKRRNAYVESASVACIGMPWIEPGYNVWIDPAGTDMVYYVNTVEHSGSNGSSYTNLGLVMGRTSEDFFEGPDSVFGCLKSSSLNSENIFVNSIKGDMSVSASTPSIDEDMSKKIRREAIAFSDKSGAEKEYHIEDESFFKMLYSKSFKFDLAQNGKISGLNMYIPFEENVLQERLDELFNHAPKSVKDRAARIKSIVEQTKVLDFII